MCAMLQADAGLAQTIRERTGLVIDPYFSATKVRWLLDHVPGARARAEAGELAFGTVDSWLLWQLTGGALHATDVTNAARTMLYDIARGDWDDTLLQALDVPRALLPQVLPSAHRYGETLPALLGAAVPVCGVAGDQQSALVGQACFHDGQAKNTYGTGCFLLRHTGSTLRHSAHGLVSTRAAQPATPPAFAMEGSVFVGGAVVQWLRDGLQAISSSADVEALAGSVPDAGGVVFVPAFTGLGAPYWAPEARGSIVGLTRGSSVAHIARAALESIAFQSAVLLQAMNADAERGGSAPVTELRVDGGACANGLLMQFQADILGIPVVRPHCIETTALGAAFLAGLGCGLYAGLDEIAARWSAGQRFEPRMPPAEAADRRSRWDAAIAQVLHR
jgi:glycerol kinase